MPRKNYFELLPGLMCEDYLTAKAKNASSERKVELELLSWKEVQEKLQSSSKTEERQEAQRQLDEVYPDMEATLRDPARRKVEAEAMKATLLTQLNALIDLMAASSERRTLAPADVRKMAEDHRLKMPTVKTALEKKGFKMQVAVAMGVDEFLMSRTDFQSLRDGLEKVRAAQNPRYPNTAKVQTLYDLIGLLDGEEPEKWPALERADTKELSNRCEAQSIGFSTDNSPFGLTVLSLVSIGKTKVFDSDEDRSKYDYSLKAEALEKRLDFAMLFQLAESIKRSDSFAEERIQKIDAVFHDRQKSIAFYSDRMGLNPPYEPQRAVYTMTCPECQAIMEFSDYDEALRVNKCVNGHVLFTRCPRPGCNQMMPRTAQVCPNPDCALNLLTFASFDGYLSAASDALKRKDIAEARKNLARARSAKDWDSRLDALQRSIDALAAEIEKPAAEIRAQIGQGNYREAWRRLNALKASRPDMRFSDLEQEIKPVLDWAEQEVQRARRCGGEESVGILLKVAAKVRDYGDIPLPPPPPVSQLSVIAVDGEKAWKLKWDYAGQGARFTVVRKINDKPRDIDDGLKLSQNASETDYLDRSVKPGEEYGYAVFAVRAGKVSAPATRLMGGLHPELDVESVKVELTDDACQISWAMPDNCAGVQIIRGEGGTVGKITRAGSSWQVTGSQAFLNRGVFTDKTLRRNHDYCYRLQTMWKNSDGETELSDEGVVTPVVRLEDKPEPLEIRARVSARNEITVSWNRQAEARAVNLLNVSRPLAPGAVLSRDELMRMGGVVATGNAQAGERTFQAQANQCYNLVAALHFGMKAVVSNTVRVSTARPAVITSCAVNGKFLEWTLDVPQGACKVYCAVTTRESEDIPAPVYGAAQIGAMTPLDPASFTGGRVKSDRISTGIVTLAAIAAYSDGKGGEFYADAAVRELRNLPKAVVWYDLDWNHKVGGGFLGLGAKTGLLLKVRREDGGALPEMKLLAKSNGKLLYTPEEADITLATIAAGTASPASVMIYADEVKKIPMGGFVRLFNTRVEESFDEPLPVSQNMLRRMK